MQTSRDPAWVVLTRGDRVIQFPREGSALSGASLAAILNLGHVTLDAFANALRALDTSISR